MAFSFPLSVANLADLLPIRQVKWKLRHNQELSGLGNGQILAAELAPSLWEGEVTTGPMWHADAMQMQARFEALDGSIQTFYLYNPLTKFPQADPDGSILASATPETASLPDAKTMTIDGLPASYVLTIGDMIAFDYGTPTRRALHRILTTVTANGSGVSPVFEVRPYISSAVVINTPVTLIKPAAKVLLIPDSFDIQNDTLKTCVISFKVIQRL